MDKKQIRKGVRMNRRRRRHYWAPPYFRLQAALQKLRLLLRSSLDHTETI